MIDENTFSEPDPISEIADERGEDPYVIQLAPKQLFQISHIGGIVRLRRVGFGAERSGAHHFFHGLFEIGFPGICRSALVHQVVHIAFLYSICFLLTAGHLQTASVLQFPWKRPHCCP